MTAIRVEVNPETQTGIYYGPGGQVLQMGKHGTSRTKGTPHTTNQDGKELDDGVLTDYESD